MRQISCVVLALKQDRLLPLWSCTTPTLPADDSQNLNQPLTYMQVLFKLLFAFPFSFFFPDYTLSLVRNLTRLKD